MKNRTIFSILIIMIVVISNLGAQTNVSGNITTNTTWPVNGSPYVLTGNLRIRSGATLTVQSGTQINLGNYYFYVGYYNYSEGGMLEAAGVTFTGNNGVLQFEANATGTISNCNFANTKVVFNNSSGPTITNNNFDLYSPLYLYSQEVIPKMSGNTFGSGKFYVSLSFTKNTTLKNFANCTYYLNDAVRVRGGATLTIESGTQVNLGNHNFYVGYYNYSEGGALEATGVNFIGNNGVLQFESNATGTISNCNFTNTKAVFNNASGPTVTNNVFDLNSPLYLFSQEVIPRMSGNTFGSGKFYISLSFTKNITLRNYLNCTYYLNDVIRVRNGATLTIENGTQINLGNYYFYVGYYNYSEGGMLEAAGVTFTGNNGVLQFEANATGTISNCNFANTKVVFNNSSGPTITNNNFDLYSPLYLYSQEVIPKMSGNTFGSGKFYVSLSFTKNTTLKNFANCTYYLNDAVRVRGGATLTIESGTQVNLGNHNFYVGYYNYSEGGVLQATGVTFTGNNSVLQFENTAFGNIANCEFVNQVKVNGINQSTVKMNQCNFGVFCSVMNSSSFLIDAKNNYWGHESGPYHATLNPTGQGAHISNNVEFNPYSSSSFPLTYPIPAITSIYPSFANRLQTLNVIIKGIGFYSNISSVYFGSNIFINSTNVDSFTQITANITILANAATGTRNVSITNVAPGGGTVSLQNAIDIHNPLPTLSTISPTSGNRFQTLDIVFSGTNFISGVTTINAGMGILLNSTTVSSSTSLTANITITASADTGNRSFTITNPAPQGGTSEGKSFKINNPMPTIVSTNPTNGTLLQTLDVTINGTGFISNVSSVNFGADISVNSFVVNSSSRILANITIGGNARTGIRSISITNGAPLGGTAVLQNAFTVNTLAPAISDVSPEIINRLQTINMTVNGSGFSPGVTSVNFGTDITVNFTTINTSTQFIANITVAASAALGDRTVTVTNAPPGGGTANLSNVLIVQNPLPTLERISPMQCAKGQTLDIELYGTNFINGASTVTVDAGILINSVAILNDTCIFVNITTPIAIDTGVWNFCVANLQPGGGISNYVKFFVINNPPTAVRLIDPVHEYTLKLTRPSIPLVFCWQKSFDPDPADTVRYSLFFKGASWDTTLCNISDTTVSLDVMNHLIPASDYFWTVLATDGLNIILSPDTFQIHTSDTVTSVRYSNNIIPDEFHLCQNFPNPFNPSTILRYAIPTRSEVKLQIYNTLGQAVAIVVNATQQPGYYEIPWLANVSSGMYFYRLEAVSLSDPAQRFTQIRKMILLK